MGNQADTENDVAVLESEQQNQDETESQQTGEAASETDAEPTGETQAEGEDEVTVSLGEDSPPEPEEQKAAPEWVRELRKKHREQESELRALREKVKTYEQPKQVDEVGEKPTLASVDYDEDLLAERLLAWNDAKRRAEEKQKQAEEAKAAQQREWQSKLDAYGADKTALKVPDFEDAEAETLGKLSQVQQGILIEALDGKAAALVYALGRNQAQLEKLAGITNPVKFAVAVAELKGQLKVSQRKPPAPESRVTGTAPASPGGTDKTLEMLRKEAEATGNYTKVVAYKNQLKSAAKT